MWQRISKIFKELLVIFEGKLVMISKKSKEFLVIFKGKLGK